MNCPRCNGLLIGKDDPACVPCGFRLASVTEKAEAMAFWNRDGRFRKERRREPRSRGTRL